MEKNEIQTELKDALRTEESAVRVYMKHLKAITQRSPLNDDQKNTIREVIGKLIDENRRHHRIVQNLLNGLQTGEYYDN